MIEAKELRLCNWYFQDGKPVQVSEIRDWYFSDDEPIPLTPEVLLNSGFEIVSNAFCYDNFRLRKKYLTPKNDEYKLVFHPFLDFIGGDVEVKYVHQLQNLYFSLTGTELDIKL